jgi:diguanylate cyclase (GGDEF)-like protein/PAS domain S-box-containing protein
MTRERDATAGHRSRAGGRAAGTGSAWLDGVLPTVIDRVSDAVLVLHRNGRVAWANRTAATFFGRPGSALVGCDVGTRLPELALAARSGRPAARRARPGVGFQTTARTRARDAVPVSVRCAEVESGAGDLVVLTIRDVSKRRSAQSQLRTSRIHFRKIVETAGEAILTMDGRGRITLFNAGAERIFGHPAAEMLGRPIETLMPERFRARHADYVAAFARGRRAARMMGERRRIVGLRRNGEEFPAEASISRFELDGTVVFNVVLRDVTRQEQAKQALRERDLLFRAVFEQAFQMVVVLDQEGVVREVNRTALETIALPRPEVVGRPLWRLRWPPARLFGRQIRRAVRRVRRGREVRQEVRIWDAQQGERILDCSLKPMVDAEGGLCRLIAEARDITARVTAERRVRYLAEHDVLTGLANRSLFGSRLDRALRLARRHGRRLAVLCLDLNDFKSVNDGLGHAAGDELLRQVAGRLQELAAEVDTVARLGGDEFALIQAESADRDAAAALARRIVQRLSEPVIIEGQVLHSFPSIGIALYPDDGADAERLLRHADLALYRAKAAGKGAFRLYLPEMSEEKRRRRQLEKELRMALEHEQLALAFQPQFHLARHDVVAVEALLRWRHPKRGPVPPDAFIPVAEESGLILEIGAWVLRRACEQARRWRDAGLPPARMAVNLSPVQLAHQDIVDMTARILAETEVPATLLEYEITEGTLMQQSADNVAALAALHRQGVSISIDDFGTGYSSLAYLRRFPIDRIKIDRSFVADIPDDRDAAAIVCAILTLSHSLGRQVIAEGVETAAQVAFLRAEGCDAAQGYHFTAPLSAEACGALLARAAQAPARPVVAASGAGRGVAMA